MLNILTIVGARPQFIKAAMVSRAVAQTNAAESGAAVGETILHTGQHYDVNMSRVFFEQLGIPEPAVNLGVGSGSHGETTAQMLAGIEAEILARKPDWVLVYGDTNSTLAGALAAAKLHVPVAHVEAGLRSFNKAMPEEINRVLTDHVSELLLCPTPLAVRNLADEGLTCGVHHTGDVMYDAALVFGEIANRRSSILAELELEPGSFCLATVHRAENTDVPERLSGIARALSQIGGTRLPVVLPLHPRTRCAMAAAGLAREHLDVRFIEPVSYLDMVRLEQAAAVILTDSGGVQKEAYFHGVPCITLRDETEWTETVEHGWNQVVGADSDGICAAFDRASNGTPIAAYGDGHAAEAIVGTLHA